MDAATSLDELRAVFGLLIYGGVFESSHGHLESLHEMDGTGRLVFLVVMVKNHFRFLLSFLRFGDKATRNERRLEEKWQHFEKFGTFSLVCVNHCIWLVQLSASMNNYFHSEEEMGSDNICRQNQASMESKFG